MESINNIQLPVWKRSARQVPRLAYAYQTGFAPCPQVCKNVTTVQIRLKSVGLPFFTDQGHIILTVVFSQLILHTISSPGISGDELVWVLTVWG